MNWRKFLLLGLSLPLAEAQAYEYVSLEKPAVMYEEPSLQAKKLASASRYLPLEQIVAIEGWVKVRDSSGALSWVQKNAISSRRYVIVTVALADIRSAPDAAAAVVFQARQNVALERIETTEGGWVKVRHQDGSSGFIKVVEVWGE